jgi:TonB family protein
MLFGMKTAVIFLLLGSITGSPTRVFDGPPFQEAPRVVYAVRPAYPAVAAAKRISGTVIVDVEIDPKGLVKTATVRSGSSILRKAAKDAAVRWRFNGAESSDSFRSAQLIFIFHPTSYVPEPDEPDFKRPYQMSVSWQGTANARQIRNEMQANRSSAISDQAFQ